MPNPKRLLVSNTSLRKSFLRGNRLCLRFIEGGNPYAQLNTGLVSWWKLGDATGDPRVDSFSNNTLTNNNSVTQEAGVSTAGSSGFVIASTQYLSIADTAALSPTAQASVSFWMRFPTATVNMGLVVKWNYGGQQGSWAIQTDGTNNDEIQTFVADALNDPGNNNGITTDANLVINTWYHVVMVYDGSLAGNANRLKVYVDGTQKTISFVGTIPAVLQDSTAAYEIGRFSTVGRYFGGMIEGNGFYNIALTQAKITQLYNAGTPLQPNGGGTWSSQ